MRIGIFGGTFNPPHKGHGLLLREIAHKAHFDRVIIIPSSVPPHKEVAVNSPEHRLNMTRLAFPEYEVSDLEIRRGGKSYTSDTLRQLHSEHPQDELCFICGSDMFLTIEKWHEPDEIFRLATIITASRDRRAYPRLILMKLRYLIRYRARCKIIFLKPVVISSSEIRLGEVRGEDISAWVEPQVYDYIQQHELYDGVNNGRK